MLLNVTSLLLLLMLQSTRKMILLGTRVVILEGKLEISLNLTSSKILGKTMCYKKNKVTRAKKHSKMNVDNLTALVHNKCLFYLAARRA